MFVFVYPSHHVQQEPFPHLVVIVTTLKTPKNIFCYNSNIMQNGNSIQCGWDTQELSRMFRLF